MWRSYPQRLYGGPEVELPDREIQQSDRGQWLKLGRFLALRVMFVDFPGIAGVKGTYHQDGAITSEIYQNSFKSFTTAKNNRL